jgi:hypothetical protein
MGMKPTSTIPKFFTACCAAIEDGRYKEAMSAIEDGIAQSQKSRTRVGATQLLMGMESVLHCLGLALEEEFGLRWLKVNRRPGKRAIRCNFCGRTTRQVAKMIAGPGCHICDLCAKQCYDLTTEVTSKSPTRSARPSEKRKPSEKRRPQF